MFGFLFLCQFAENAGFQIYPCPYKGSALIFYFFIFFRERKKEKERKKKNEREKEREKERGRETGMISILLHLLRSDLLPIM